MLEKNLLTDDAFRRIHILKMFGNGYEHFNLLAITLRL